MNAATVAITSTRAVIATTATFATSVRLVLPAHVEAALPWTAQASTMIATKAVVTTPPAIVTRIPPTKGLLAIRATCA
jgi:hypothetical protein